ncbi:hypothetical protein XENOCAPTIV_015167 [Xenoophorus captivus]|uniref:Uncharacterized protein n=1 Tax=Xenoophorus captivus TaxID=1517983 RepID=A0ABV0RCE4_9TELE
MLEQTGRRRRGCSNRRFLDGVKEDMKVVGVREDAEDRVRWRQMTRCGDSCKGKAKRKRRYTVNHDKVHCTHIRTNNFQYSRFGDVPMHTQQYSVVLNLNTCRIFMCRTKCTEPWSIVQP